MSPKETIYMENQILFSGKNKKNIILLSAKYVHNMLSVHSSQLQKGKNDDAAEKAMHYNERRRKLKKNTSHKGKKNFQIH